MTLNAEQDVVINVLDRTINRAQNRTIYDVEQSMVELTANDLKVRGISAIEQALAKQPEAVISVRGKPRFVVMDMAQYHHLRECELDTALSQIRADVEAGRFVQESASAHMARLEALLASEPKLASHEP